MAHGYVNLTEVTPGSAGSWQDVDLSALIPSGAVAVGLLFVNTAAGTNAVGARKNGSTDNRNATLSGTAWTAFHVGVDGSRIVEVYVGHATNVDVYLFWWADGAAAGTLTNAADKSTGTAGAYQDVDISADTGADTALVAFFEIINAGTFGIRCNTATEDPRYSNSNHHGVAANVDGSEICEQHISSTVIDLFLNMWLKAEFTGYVNAIDRSESSTFGSYVDVTALPVGADGGLYRGGAGNFAVALALRTKGAGDDYYRDIIRQAYRIVEGDAGRQIQQKAEDSSVDIAEVGYLTPASSGATLSPGAGALTILGLTASLALALAPAAGLVALSGGTPTLSLQRTLVPSAGSLTLAAETPVLRTNVAAGAGALLLTGGVAGVQASLTPAPATLLLSGGTPSVSVQTVLSATAGALSLAGGTPQLRSQLSPTVGALLVTGGAADLVFGQRVEPSIGALTVSGGTPVLQSRVTPTIGALALVGGTPTMSRQTVLSAAAGTLALAGGQPSLRATLSPSAGFLAFVGGSASLSGGTMTLSPGSGALAWSGDVASVATTLAPVAGELHVAGGAAAMQWMLRPSLGTLVLTGGTPALGDETASAVVIRLTGRADRIVRVVGRNDRAVRVTGRRDHVIHLTGDVD